MGFVLSIAAGAYNQAMPELPEVENVRRTLAAGVMGQRVVRVAVYRREVVRGKATPRALLVGATIGELIRRGKQMVIPAADGTGQCLVVHLGMTGSMRYFAQGSPPNPALAKHTHLVWRLDGGGRMIFHDPRRFGGVWTFADREALARHWQNLGEDALTITMERLYERLASTSRGIKATLLDQSILAGLGNIYVDELLFRQRIHPLTPARRLTASHVEQLVREMRCLLAAAIKARGSTVRSYSDAAGRGGDFQLRHQVYGRAGEACLHCDTILRSLIAGGRTTVFCPVCQLRWGRRRFTKKKDL